MGIPQFEIQNDSLNTPVTSQCKTKFIYSPESQKQRINEIKIYKIIISGNRYLLNPYVAELSAILLSLKQVNL